MKNIFFLLLIITLSSCTDQELGWFVISPNNIEGLTNLKFLLSGLTTTIYISIVSIIISMVLGLIIAIPSLAKNKFLTYINSTSHYHNLSSVFLNITKIDERHIIY